ncbi:hypothetical protein [Lentzea sp. HUAS12]|uniref:hypothetical protein n=1 Tax=Lentzea sp. HUAS12 TaxID=2951806 RepID=UPI00209F02E9|nr:hypothetical protein [Lentzea sp. HUAS12]USX55476.1 hypothetical protein ND450_15660 [Lentzea sp. HUAS12]
MTLPARSAEPEFRSGPAATPPVISAVTAAVTAGAVPSAPGHRVRNTGSLRGLDTTGRSAPDSALPA